MNIIKDGLVKIHKEFSKLEKNWDGYGAVPLRKEVLDTLQNKFFIVKIIKLFVNVGFEEKDIFLAPCSTGTYQLEAENKNIYFEIEVDEKFYEEIINKK